MPGSFITAFPNENSGRVTVGLPDPNTLTSAVAQNQTITVTPAFLTRSLNQGTDVTLQANNSIQVNAALNLTGGRLALSAPWSP